MSAFDLSDALPAVAPGDPSLDPSLDPSADPSADPSGPEVLVLAAAPGPQDGSGPVLLLEGAAPTGLDTSALTALLPRLGFTGEQDCVQRLPASAVAGQDYRGPGILMVVGLGGAWAGSDPAVAGTVDDEAALGADRAGLLRRAAGRATRALSGTAWAALVLPTLNEAELAGVLQGAAMGAYRWSGLDRGTDGGGGAGSGPGARPAEAVEHSDDGAGRAVPASSGTQAPVGRVTIVSPLAKDPHAREELSCAVALAEATALARDLVNEPPNRLDPRAFAQRALQVARDCGAQGEVWDDRALEQDGFGGILAVGQGSRTPPRLVRLEWAPAHGDAHIALIGKGITFDSGGLSLKPPASMPEMKSDMAGAAVVLGVVLAAARLELPVRVTAWLALAENMPGPGAQRPSDIITMFSGRTVEVTNTDAEGRLVMADALAKAVSEQPDAVLDVATLTGAQIIALGDHVAGVMGTPTLREEVVAAAQRAGEAFWPMPLPSGLRSALDSHAADMSNANISSRAGGMLSAGLFLREFVGTTPWAHLDVAGPAFNSGAAWGLTPSGGTAMGLATLLELLRSRAPGR